MNKIFSYIKMSPQHLAFSIFMVTLGSLLYAIAVNSFVIPNHFGNGGVAGIAIVVYYITNIATGTTNFIVNAILIAIGWKYLEKRTLIFTIYCLFAMSAMMNWVHLPVFISDNALISAIAAGVLMGAGMGIIVRGHGTTAGTDIIAIMLKNSFGLQFSAGVFLCNSLIILGSSFVIGAENTVITLIMKYITTNVLDFMAEGLSRRKSMLIISDQKDAIAKEIIEKIDRGITVLKAYGYYSHKDKDVLYVIVNRNQLVRIQRLISRVDPHAFVTISDVQQVIGQGFTFFNPTNKNKRFYL